MARKMIEVRSPAERALLIGAPRKGTKDAANVEEHLDELARLADTAGAVVVGRVVQFVAAPTPDFYIGRGKVEQVRERLAELGSTLLIVDEELSPTQGKHLEDALKIRVMDRAELILDIFALRARTSEAKAQVELAQLEYLLPRLTRMWVHLSRIRGGIGLRGPGETQLETDRRMIRQKIGKLKKDLQAVAEHRQRLRERSRDRGVVKVALIGYTNAGKSSLLRALTGASAHIEDRLFATLDTTSREVTLERRTEPERSEGEVGLRSRQRSLPATSDEHRRVRFTDTVGFIRKLPHDLVASFRSTLEEAEDADVLVHVVDASHADWHEQALVVNQTLEEAGLAGRPVVMALNKADLLDEPTRERRQREAEALGFRAVPVSAAKGDRVAQLSGMVAGGGGVRRL